VRPVLLVAVALLALAGCGGSEAESPSASATLFLAGDGILTVVDVDAGRAEERPLAELAPGDPSHRIVRREDELVLWGYDTYVLDADLSRPPRKLGDSWFFVPSSKPDRVWLAHLDPESPETVRALAAVSEVSVDGRVTVPRVRLPQGRWPVAAVGDDLVFESRRGGLELWSPAARAFTARLPGAALGPSQGDLLAWCRDEGRTLHVTDVGAESDRAVTPPGDFAAFDCASGAFSPDGTTLAVPVTRTLELGVSRSLALVDVEKGVASAVQGSTVHPDYVFVAWSQAGDRVFLSGGPADDRHLLQYRPGEPRAVRLPVVVRDFYGMAAR
jgi:hypothetical protein